MVRMPAGADVVLERDRHAERAAGASTLVAPASSAAARASAPSLVDVRNALSVGVGAAMRSSAARQTSTADAGRTRRRPDLAARSSAAHSRAPVVP